MPLTQPADVPAYVQRARRAQQSWRCRPIGERAAVLDAAASVLTARSDELGELLARESGKVLTQAVAEVRGAAALLRGNAEHARALEGRLLPTAAWPGTTRDIAWEERVPLGVVAAILPFNFPVELLIEKAAAALVMGNAVVVKPSEKAPLAVVEVVAILHEAGVPPDALPIVNGGAETAAALASAEGVAAVSLTGSTRAGVAVAAATATSLRRLHLELGGNDAAIILEDADVEHAVAEVVHGRILMNGQSCASNKRILVHRAIADRFRDALVKKVAALRVGDPLDPSTDVGPLIDERAAATVAEQVRRAVADGARLIFGDSTPRGAFFGPHVLEDVPPTAAIACDDEVFGPVFPLISFESEDEAVSIANASTFGLMGSVFSADVGRALALGDRLETGGVVINGTGNYRPPFVPFGGVKMSGLGREGLGYTLEELSRPRFTVLRNLRP